jgi:uncharacterized cupin superfamily protein
MAVIIHDPARLAGRRTTVYPAAFAEGLKGRIKRALGDAGGLTQFGVNLTTLEPGAISALRHWHSAEDEFIYVLSGEVTLITDAGAEMLTAGMAATFPAGNADAHQIVNRSSTAATYLEVGTRAPDDEITYPDVDLHRIKRNGRGTFVRKSGEPYE